MPLRFSGGKEIDPQLGSDIQSVNAFNVEQLGHFADLIISWMLAPHSTQLMDAVGTFATAHGVNPKALRNSVRGMLLFFKGALKENISPAQVQEDCIALGMSESHAGVLSKKWSKNFLGLSVSMGTTLMANQLVDMEWKFGVTAAR